MAEGMPNDTNAEEYPYSMGTTAAVNTVLNLIQSEPLRCDVVLINVATIARNCLNVDDKLTNNFANVVDEIEKVENILVDNLNTSSLTSPVILWYIAPYEKIVPANFLRPVTGARQKLALLRLALTRWIRDRHNKENIKGKVRIRYEVLSPHIQTKYQLAAFVRSLRTANNLIMISNYSVDFHLAEVFPHFILVECYTGKQVTPKEFGEKVFKNPLIPFNMVSHVIFGDKELIKPAGTVGEKKRIVELASKERWNMHTQQFVYDSIRQHFRKLFDLKDM